MARLHLTQPLVVVMSLWLVYRRLGWLRVLPPEPGSPAIGAVLLGFGTAFALWATHTASPDLLVPSLMLNGAAIAWLWRGGRGVLTVALPVAFLGFAIPVPAPLLNEILFWLQIGTTEIAGFFLYGLGIPHFVAGEQIQRTTATFSVIESCSGLRSIEILTMMAVLMADLFRRRGLHAVLVVVAAPPVAFLLNGVRAVLLILNPLSEVASVHNLQGVAILLGGLVVLYVWDGVLGRLLPDGAPGNAAPRSGDSSGPPPLPAGPLAALALGVVLLAPLFVAEAGRPDYARGVLSELVDGLGDSSELEVDRRFLGSVGFRGALHRRVRTDSGDELVVFVGVGDRYERSRSSLSPKTGLPGSGWVVEQESQEELFPGGPSVTVRVMRSGSRRWLVYHWYEGMGGLPYEAFRSWAGLDRSRFRERQEILAIRVQVPLAGPLPTAEPEGRKVFLSFYDLFGPLIRVLSDALSGKNFS